MPASESTSWYIMDGEFLVSHGVIASHTLGIRFMYRFKIYFAGGLMIYFS